MNLITAKQKIFEAVPSMQPGEKWMVLSKDHGKHCTLTDEDYPELLGYRTKDVIFVYQHSDMESANLILGNRDA